MGFKTHLNGQSFSSVEYMEYCYLLQVPKMGRIFLDHIGGSRLFSCAACDTILTNRSELISTRFTGATGRAFLFNRVVNLSYR